jgi:hypothetical protein
VAAGEAEPLAKEIDERGARVHGFADILAIYRKGDSAEEFDHGTSWKSTPAADQLPAGQAIDRNDSDLQHTLTPAHIQKAGRGKIPRQIVKGMRRCRLPGWPDPVTRSRRLIPADSPSAGNFTQQIDLICKM